MKKEETMMSIQNDRTDETTVRCPLQQTSGAQLAEQAKDDPRADDPNTIMRLLHQTAQLVCSRYDRALRAQLPGLYLLDVMVWTAPARHLAQ